MESGAPKSTKNLLLQRRYIKNERILLSLLRQEILNSVDIIIKKWKKRTKIR